MGPYYLLIGLPMLLSGMRYRDNNRIFNKRFPLFMFFVIFLVMLSLRSVECGTDLLTYRNKFQYAQVISLKSLFDLSLSEPGFSLFISFNKLLSESFQFFLFSCAIVSVVPIMAVYLKETNHNILSIALFVSVAPFTMFFSGLRQSIAIGIGAICYSFCKKDKFVPFLLFVFLAFLFHQSAIILLLMYPLTHVKITKKRIVPIIVLYAICMRFNKEIFSFLLGLNPKYESRYVISETGSYTFLILLLLLTIYSFIILRDDADEVVESRNLLVLSLFLQCFAPVNTVAMRLNYYYLIFIPIIIPQIIDHCKNRYRNVANFSLVVFIVFFILWFFKEAYTGADVMHAFPYIPFWET